MSGGPRERSHMDVRAGPQRSTEAQRRGARRSGEFEQARAFCSAGLARVELTTFVRQLLELEQELCGKRDAACHTVGEVEKGAGEEERGTVH